MSYVQRVLQPGEQVRHTSSIHWIVYWPGIGVAILAVVAYWFSGTLLLTGFWRYTADALALVAVVLLIQEWFREGLTRPSNRLEVTQAFIGNCAFLEVAREECKAR